MNKPIQKSAKFETLAGLFISSVMVTKYAGGYDATPVEPPHKAANSTIQQHQCSASESQPFFGVLNELPYPLNHGGDRPEI